MKTYIFLLLFLMVGCEKKVDDATETKTISERDINIVKESHTQELMAIPGVVGVYVGVLDDGTPCIGVMVVKLTPELQKKIPARLEGYPIRIEETGKIKPLK